MNDPWNWEIEDLRRLIGQPESIRLDFKQSAILTWDSEKIAASLSKEVSAFANTEGGVIVIGVVETKNGKSRIGGELDQGININEWSPERLQQLIESNIYPPLTGIRYKSIFIDNSYDKYYFVISIPKGTTAFQAKDFLYYGRSEFESKPLRDHEIRLRMFRGKVPEAIIEIGNLHILKTNESRSIAGQEPIFIQGRNYEFDVFLRNIGELSISHFKYHYQFSSPGFDDGEPVERCIRDGIPSGIVHNYLSGDYQGVTNVMIFPGDRYMIQKINNSFDTEKEFLDSDFTINWQLFLPDRLPLNGEINLTEEFRHIKCEDN